MRTTVSMAGGMPSETPLTQLPATISSTGMYTASTIVAANSSAVAYARAPSQVLHIVYGTGGGAGVSSGTFFPNGMNGNIRVTQS